MEWSDPSSHSSSSHQHHSTIHQQHRGLAPSWAYEQGGVNDMVHGISGIPTTGTIVSAAASCGEEGGCVELAPA